MAVYPHLALRNHSFSAMTPWLFFVCSRAGAIGREFPLETYKLAIKHPWRFLLRELSGSFPHSLLSTSKFFSHGLCSVCEMILDLAP